MSQGNIFWFWVPLFASWLLMSAEGPIVSAVINRLPDEVLMLAAQGIVISLSVMIESPIINLLATATALTKDHRAYLLIRRFTLHWLILLTIIAFLFGYTGLFDVIVIGWMDVPLQVAEWVQRGMRLMVFWSAAIGWRRFLQGILIRFNQTRKIAWGTVIRLISTGGSAVGLALWSSWPGVIIGTVAVMAGVVTEALFITLVTQPVIKQELGSTKLPEEDEPLTYRELFWFHLPLAATSLLLLLVQPMVAMSLSRLDNPTQSLAAWPVIFQVTLLTRAGANALPEVVIALTKGIESLRSILRFTIILAVVTTITTALFVWTPLVDLYLFRVQDTTPIVGEMARNGLTLFILLPAISYLISWLRGLLIKTYSTRLVNVGMAVNLLATAIILILGVLVKLDGILIVAIALNSAALIELIILWWGARPDISKMQLASQKN